MNINLIISDSDYENLMLSSTRVRGTLAAVTAGKAEFHAYAKRQTRGHQYTEFKSLHGKTRVYPDKVTVNITCDRNDPSLTRNIEKACESAIAVIEDL